MAGKCKYCGFVGTQDEIVDHAGSCPVMLEDCQPDTLEETRHIHQQTQPKICPVCHGTKQVEGPVDTLLECDFCGGTGKLRASA